MKHLCRGITAFAMVFAGACGTSSFRETAPKISSASFDQWADGFADTWVSASPQLATRLRWFTGEKQDRLDRELSLIGEWDYPWGAKAFAARAKLAKEGLAALDRFDLKTLTPEQQTSAAVIRWTLEDMIASAEFPQHRYVFDQFNGLQVDLINHLTQSQAIRTPRDVENYLTRLGLLAARVDEGIAEARAAAAAGIAPPKVLMERVIAQMDEFLSHSPHDNVFVTTLGTRIGAMSGMTADARKAAIDAAEKTVRENVIPAYRRIRALLAEEMPRASDDAGVSRLPRGDAYYAHELAEYTTTKMTAAEIHAIGLREVARLEGEMDKVLRQLGYTQGTVKERYEQAEKAAQPPASPDPRPQILADYEKWVRDAEKRAALIFDLRPKARVEVRRDPPFAEKTDAAHYSDPAPDGSRPGVFYVPLPGPTYQILRERSLSYHEAVPGHHFQIALAQEIPGLPRYRRLGVFGGNTAYIEGWALYAERLADENGWYEGDLKGRLGYLQAMLFRARRLVVDTGIHAMHWTRQQAIDYGIESTEVERYMAWPGQACAYMIGQLKIVGLREKARTAMGAKFSIREFHNQVLQSGSVPLDVLERNIDRWIAKS
jgi:uncharacterized protein (DUF885 family)